MTDQIEGFYTGYFTGLHDAGFAMFIFHAGKIVGADPMGVKFDGQFTRSASGTFDATVKVDLPPGGTTVQGVTTGPAGLNYSVDFSLPADFATRDFVKIETPLGPVNVKFKRVRGMYV